MAGLVHFSNFFRYMETAERDFFESVGLPLIDTTPGQLVGWPRGRAECKFFAPLRFGDTFDIHLLVKSIKERSLELQFRIYRHEKDGSFTQAGKGLLTTIFACVDESSGQLKSSFITEAIREKIEPAPETALRARR